MRVALILIAALLLVPVALATGTPRVHLADRAPATVSGSGFHAAELVGVSVTNGTLTLSRHVRANGSGAFTARFLRSITMKPCGQIAIKAVGARGDRAGWKTPPQVCGAPPAPVTN